MPAGILFFQPDCCDWRSSLLLRTAQGSAIGALNIKKLNDYLRALADLRGFLELQRDFPPYPGSLPPAQPVCGDYYLLFNAGRAKKRKKSFRLRPQF